MKCKIFALILALTVVSWAQTATQTPTQPPAEKAKCACCDKTASADSKTTGMACNRQGKNGKEMASCCGGKDAASCCAGKDSNCCMKDAKNVACCKDCGKDAKDKTASACCNGNCKEGCCSKMKTEHAAMNCCHHEKHI